MKKNLIVEIIVNLCFINGWFHGHKNLNKKYFSNFEVGTLWLLLDFTP